MTELDFQVFEIIGALVVVLEVDGRILYWNRRCSDLTGYSLEEVRGRKLWEFALVPGEVEPIKAVFATLQTSQHPTPYANYWLTKASQRRWIAWSHTSTRSSDGQVQYIIKTGIDRTESKRAEDSRRVSEASLGDLALEHAQLYDNSGRSGDELLEANEHLVKATIRAQELAENVESALGRAAASEQELRAVAQFREMFIGILGHDLRNPIGSIRMSAESLLHRDRLDAEDRRGVTRIITSSDRVTRMIFQLLELTRARLGGGFPIEPKPTDLRAVCRSVAEEFGAPIRLEVVGDVTGTWDPDRLAEALSNIARNATEHAAAGTTVLVRARSEGAEAVVEILNQGDPIPSDVLPFIFEPFWQATRERSTSGNLGLGLYIASQIVRASGGSLEVRSADGTTTFLMHLPRNAPEAGPPLSAAEARA